MHIEKQSSIKDTRVQNTKNQNLFGKRDVVIDFGKSLKSVNTGDLYLFTNYFANKKDRYRFVKNNINDIYNNRISLINDDLFEMKLVNVENDYFLKLKIDNILQLTAGKKIKNMPILYKFKELRNLELQYYIEKKILIILKLSLLTYII